MVRLTTLPTLTNYTVVNSKHHGPLHMAMPEQPLQTSGSIGGHTPRKHDATILLPLVSRCADAPLRCFCLGIYESQCQKPTEHDQEKATPTYANRKLSYSHCSRPSSVVHHSIQRKSAGKVDLSQTSLALGVAIEHESGNLKLEQHVTTVHRLYQAFRKATGV